MEFISWVRKGFYIFIRTHENIENNLSHKFVCLSVWILSSHSKIFHLFGNVTIAVKGCNYFLLCRWRAAIIFFYYIWHLSPLRSKVSLAYHTHCDTGHPFIMTISEDPWHSHPFPSVWHWSCHYLFLRLKSVAAGIQTPNLPLAGRTF